MLSGKALVQTLHSESFIELPVTREPASSKRCTGSECYPRTDLVSTSLCLIYWHDIRLSSAIFLSLFLLQLTLVLYPTLTVAAYLALSILTINFTFCCCYGFAGILRRTNHPHPFRKYLKRDIVILQDDMFGLIDYIVTSVSSILMTFKQLIFLKDLKSSLKFYILLWLLVPIGIWFSTMCLVLICTVGFFTLPKCYQKYKAPVDEFTISAERRLSLVFNRLQEQIATYRQRP